MADSFDNGPMPPSPVPPDTTPPQAQPNPTTRRSTFPPLWLPVTLLSFALVSAVVFLATTSTVTGSSSGIVLEAPSSNIVALKSGTLYGLAIETDESSDGKREPPTIDITTPSGTRVLPSRPGTYFDPTLTYLSVFRSPMNGDFSIIVGDAPDGAPMQIVLVERPDDGDDVVNTASFLVAGLFLLLGGGLLIMYFVIRRRASL